MKSDRLLKNLRNALLKVKLSFMGVEVDFGELTDTRTVDDRIAQLGKVKGDLQGAIAAVEELQTKAVESKSQHEALERTLKKLEEEKATTEALLRIPEESFSRVFAKASSRGRWRGIFEGLIIGFATGCASSALVWYLTK